MGTASVGYDGGEICTAMPLGGDHEIWSAPEGAAATIPIVPLLAGEALLLVCSPRELIKARHRANMVTSTCACGGQGGEGASGETLARPWNCASRLTIINPESAWGGVR